MADWYTLNELAVRLGYAPQMLRQSHGNGRGSGKGHGSQHTAMLTSDTSPAIIVTMVASSCCWSREPGPIP